MTPILIPQFLWDNIPGEDEAALLASIRDIFTLKGWDTTTVKIKKTSNDHIIVSAPNVHIEIELDVPNLKAISTIKRDADHSKDVQIYEYKILNSVWNHGLLH